VGAEPRGAVGLERECDSFARYLTGAPATAYAREKYRRGHSAMPASSNPARIDRISVALGRSGGLLLRSCDAYSRWFRPTGLLRQKLVLLLAILENSPPTHVQLNEGETGSPGRLVAALAAHGLLFAGCLLAGVLVLGPVHLATALLPNSGSEERP
jgi:hypothetical protein